MFTRRVEIQLKPHSFTEFSEKIESEVTPLLRLQKCFCDRVISIAPSRAATGDTHWETKADAEAYQKKSRRQVLKSLSAMAFRAPTTSIFEFVA